MYFIVLVLLFCFNAAVWRVQLVVEAGSSILDMVLKIFLRNFFDCGLSI